MADIIHIGFKQSLQRINALIQRGWLQEVPMEDDVGYKITAQGLIAFTKMIQLTFIVNLEEDPQFGVDFPPPDGLEKYAKYLIDEFGNSIIAFTYLEPLLSEFGINHISDIDYFIEIASRKD